MGVTGLWMLLAAGGREVSIESLSGQTLAVDASIWLTQFVKAMRDPEDGSMLRNAHLLGTFQRVAKLLFHGIRPVFVFDGDTPAIKLRTLQRRRARREKNQLSLTQTAQKLLLRQLERRAKQAVVEEETKAESNVIHINDDEEEEKKTTESPPPMPSEEVDEDDAIIEWRDHQENVEAFQRERRQEAREQFLTLAGKPEEYSLAQIQTFLKSSRFKREMKQQAAAANAPEAGRRIASEADRRYILTTANDARPAPPPAAVAADAQLLDASDSSVGLFSEYVQKQSQSQPTQRAPKILHVDDDVLMGANGKPLVLRTDHPQWMVPKKTTSQRRGVVWEHKADGSLVASLDPTKMQLTAEEASILPPSLFDVGRPKAEVKDQYVEWGDEVEAKDALVSDSDTEWEDVVTQPSNTAPVATSTVPVATPAAPITIDIDDDDVEWLDVSPRAMPSVAESATIREDASDDLPVPTVQNTSNTDPTVAVAVDDTASPSTTLLASHDAIVIGDASDVEDDWQDVLPPEAFAAPREPRPTSPDTLPTTIDSTVGVGKPTTFVVPDAAVERTTWSAEATPPSSPVLRPTAAVLDADALGAWNDEDNLFERRVSKALSAEDDDDVVTLGLARNDDALQAVMTTASNLTQWAAGAIKRAIRDHQQKHGGKPLEDDATPRYLTRTTPTEPVVVDSGRFLVADDGGETDAQLKRSRNQQMRDVDGVTDEMQNDVMELLRLFGVPFIVAPMEAEAQCATLEKLGLVTGVITDDSDIFAFGGQRVYKNMFKTSKFVEAFSMADIERELGLDQKSMIALALLLGSDYTDGIHGVGVVNATEIVHAFPGLDGLCEFKAWVQDFDLAAQLKPLPKLSEAELKALSPLERFKHTHHKVRRNWHIADAFPNAHVVKAYLEPETDRSDARFSWSTPDLANLRVFCGRTFGWPLEKVNATLLPIVQAATRGWSETQTRIDSYFTSYKDGVKYAKIRSKRLQAVVQDIHETHEKQAPAKRQKRKAKTTD
ncbi:hypothetical protein SDRG_02143 [Saprolegnia diclina VS20]|uniref:DNA excision repair protein ERCC-5 n=1 Tax=Saprolegnia diclina (strain VS20) TaxID=1156394 RepID=T0S7L4_SAPDV|nr:hypothetical protein SDRG_02143 [Saprolegnia diclina VS20]EQC41093.1 hypothetical protein SDRG_02143 [Saprolegnia diclina VS20]|eukprot:XP_008605937.1 hypothetical protein SDRG_02143 [Saprolegnia diclina VS20]